MDKELASLGFRIRHNAGLRWSIEAAFSTSASLIALAPVAGHAMKHSSATRYIACFIVGVFLPLAGYIEAAAREFSIIPPDSVPQELKYSYFNAGRQMHSYIASFFSGGRLDVGAG